MLDYVHGLCDAPYTSRGNAAEWWTVFMGFVMHHTLAEEMLQNGGLCSWAL